LLCFFKLCKAVLAVTDKVMFLNCTPNISEASEHQKSQITLNVFLI
jgi:hypothetical protein